MWHNVASFLTFSASLKTGDFSPAGPGASPMRSPGGTAHSESQGQCVKKVTSGAAVALQNHTPRIS